MISPVRAFLGEKLTLVCSPRGLVREWRGAAVTTQGWELYIDASFPSSSLPFLHRLAWEAKRAAGQWSPPLPRLGIAWSGEQAGGFVLLFLQLLEGLQAPALKCLHGWELLFTEHFKASTAAPHAGRWVGRIFLHKVTLKAYTCSFVLMGVSGLGICRGVSPHCSSLLGQGGVQPPVPHTIPRSISTEYGRGDSPGCLPVLLPRNYTFSQKFLLLEITACLRPTMLLS